jgi:glycine/serine hydroxymethyltransferase
MQTEEMKVIGRLMTDVLKNPEKETLLEKSRKRVMALCDAFPLYPSPEGHPA